MPSVSPFVILMLKKTIAGIILLSAFSSLSLEQAPSNQRKLPPIEYQFELDEGKSELFTAEVKDTNYDRGYRHGITLKKLYVQRLPFLNLTRSINI